MNAPNSSTGQVRAIGLLLGALFIGLIVGLYTAFFPPGSGESESNPTSIEKAHPGPTQSQADLRAHPPELRVQRLDWKSLESDDYKKYIANLRNVGGPN